MIQIYCDASFRMGVGGMAVVAGARDPLELDGLRRWRLCWNVVERRMWGLVVFHAGCRCGTSGEAELRAMGMAFIVACELMRVRGEWRAEIVSDSLSAIRDVMGDKGGLPFLENMQRLWRQRRIILSKVGAHRGNRFNEISDACSRWARIDTEKKLRSRFSTLR